MDQYEKIAPIEELKEQARRLRNRLRDTGVAVSHSKALELVAQQHGARDWNTLAARAGNRPAPLQVGDRVRGQYLGQPFVGMIKALSLLGDDGTRRITLHFDDPVDVVKFESFSSMRQRVTGVIGTDGRSFSRTSDGVPHLVVGRA
jgi:hypothetical protein